MDFPTPCLLRATLYYKLHEKITEKARSCTEILLADLRLIQKLSLPSTGNS
jgi:hypothetical protein